MARREGGRERHGLLVRDREHGQAREEGGRERGREAERPKREVEIRFDWETSIQWQKHIHLLYMYIHEYMCISTQISVICVSSCSPSCKFVARCEVLRAYAWLTHVQNTHA